MTRIIEHEATGPTAIAKDQIEGTHAYICRCGLSKNAPFCDGTHKQARTEAPGVLFRYERRGDQLVREPIQIVAQRAETVAQQD